jgi:mannosyltransferase OCH1-like enzyme
MITKVIHYCWFGGNQKSQAIIDCINSWKKYMPNYELVEWNESNFDINCNDYVKEAYNCKKWAFVTDYVRLWVLYNYGGIYMDTDVEVFKPFDEFLSNTAFTGFENVGYPVTATMGSVKDNPLIKEMIDYYSDKHFEWLGYGNTTTNTVIMSDILSCHGIDRNRNELQRTANITIYPKDTFCPYPIPTESSYAMHKMFGSWGW